MSQVLGLMTKAPPLEKLNFKYGEDEEGEIALEEESKESGNIDYDFSYPPVEDYIVRHTLWPELNKFYGHGYELKAMATNHAGTLIASSSKSQTQEHAAVFLWDPTTYSVIDKLVFHNYTAVQIGFSRDDEYLVTVSRDRIFCIYKHYPEDKQHPYKLLFHDQSHTRIIWSASFTHDSKYFATAARDKIVKIWEMHGVEAKPIKALEFMFETGVTAVAFADKLSSNNSYLFAVGLENGVVQVCEFVPGEKIEIKAKVHSNVGHSLTVNRIKFQAQEKSESMVFATTADDHSVRIFEIVGF